MKNQETSISNNLLTLAVVMAAPFLLTFCIYMVFNWFLASLFIPITMKQAFGFVLLLLLINSRTQGQEHEPKVLGNQTLKLMVGMLFFLLIGYLVYLI